MGRDTTYIGTTSELTGLTNYVSSIAITETASAAAIVKLRDSIAVASAPSAVDGAAGNVTTGLHMMAMTYVTRWGESLQGTLAEFTAAGSKIATVTIPRGPATTAGTTFPAVRDVIVGRRLYVTKAGTPTTGVTPTNAQWWLVLADLSTTLASGMNTLPLAGNASITVADTTGFASAGNILVTTSSGVQPVAYTSVDATHFLGCTMLRPAYTGGLMATSGAVTQPMIGNNTSTTYSWNIADANLANTRPPTTDTGGRPLRTYKIPTSTALEAAFGSNVLALENNGGLYVEVNSGAATWEVSGR